MAVYEYVCKACDHRGEYEAKISERDQELPKVCPECMTPDCIERTFPTKTSFALKGGGWFDKGGY